MTDVQFQFRFLAWRMALFFAITPAFVIANTGFAQNNLSDAERLEKLKLGFAENSALCERVIETQSLSPIDELQLSSRRVVLEESSFFEDEYFTDFTDLQIFVIHYDSDEIEFEKNVLFCMVRPTRELGFLEKTNLISWYQNIFEDEIRLETLFPLIPVGYDREYTKFGYRCLASNNVILVGMDIHNGVLRMLATARLPEQYETQIMCDSRATKIEGQ